MKLLKIKRKLRKKCSEGYKVDNKKICFDCFIPSMKTVPFYEKDEPYVGRIKVIGPYTYCKRCKTGWVSYQLGLRIEQAKMEKASELLLKNYPPDKYEYLSEEEVFQKKKSCFDNFERTVYQSEEGYLKHLRYFIFNTIWREKRIYLKKSFELYQEKGCGWFDITKPETI